MKIEQVDFIKSSRSIRESPRPEFPEYAFWGRSNVGKSSLINMILGRNDIAKISSKPGKTRLINHFLVNNSWYLVDLPGYGYAVRSKSERAAWDDKIREYLQKRESLMYCMVLVDSRLEPQKIDLDTVNWLGAKNIPIIILFTKVDKLSRGEMTKGQDAFLKALSATWEELPPSVVTSSRTKLGREELLDHIEKNNRDYPAIIPVR